MTAISAGSRPKARWPPASRSATRANGLTAERRVVSRSASPRARRIRPVWSTSTTSPRCALSSMSPRICRTRTGRADGRRGARRGEAGAGRVEMGTFGTVGTAKPAVKPDVGYPARPPNDGHRRRPRTPMEYPTLHVSNHPAVAHKLGILRDEETEPKKFREVVRELSWLLGDEALADARLRETQVTTPLETMT